jgi:chromosome segregation ATPase
MSTRDAYVQKMKAALDEWNAELSRLEARAAAAQADARIKYKAQIESVRKQRDAGRAKLRELESASEAAWRDMQRGFESAWDDIHRAAREALRRFD